MAERVTSGGPGVPTPGADADELTRLRRELATARAEQAATASILRVIASSPTGLQRALDAILASAAQLGGAEIGWLFHERDGLLYL